MNVKVAVATLAKVLVMGVVLALVLLLGSGHTDWYRAWLFVGVTLSVQCVASLALERLNPGLLEERRKIRQGTKTWDRWLMPMVALIGPLAVWITAALDMRFHWPPALPLTWSLAALAACLAGMAFTMWAMVTNRFFASTVRIQSERGHVVVDGGPYRYVRHPGYTGAVVFTLATPVVLGSWNALVAAAFVVLAIAVRTALEDRMLRRELPGYAEYSGRVRWRLAPGVW